jgi:hypothetical protein
MHRTAADEASKKPNVPTPKPHLTYYGGPVIEHVRAVAVFWNDKVAYQSKLEEFYQWFVTSPVLAWQSEYNTKTPKQSIVAGEYVSSVVDSSAPPKKALTNEDVQAELARMLDAGEVPANDPNTLYMIHFPPGVSVSLDGNDSCDAFCAYHNTMSYNGGMVYYGVVPDQGGACAGGCGDDADPVNNLTSVSSHEFLESVTDPGVGLATGNKAPLGWYDQVNGENGDICTAEQATVEGWVVQKTWSNKHNACIATTP